ncbi:MAG: RHS repeat-associated core domain-containing protein [Desulforhopalus sp.]
MLSVNHKFTGQELDDDTGLYNYNARLYDPVVGKFVSADTIVPQPKYSQAFNRYTYCLNNPVRYVDPSGHHTGGYNGPEDGDEMADESTHDSSDSQDARDAFDDYYSATERIMRDVREAIEEFSEDVSFLYTEAPPEARSLLLGATATASLPVAGVFALEAEAAIGFRLTASLSAKIASVIEGFTPGPPGTGVGVISAALKASYDALDDVEGAVDFGPNYNRQNY